MLAKFGIILTKRQKIMPSAKIWNVYCVFFSLIYVYFFTHPTFLTLYTKYKIKIDHSMQAESKFLIEHWIQQEAKIDKTALLVTSIHYCGL